MRLWACRFATFESELRSSEMLAGLQKNLGGKPLPLHYYLGLDERTNPLDEIVIDDHTFFEACARSKQDIILAFLVSGFDVNANEGHTGNGYGYTGLHYASDSGDAALVATLCSMGANVYVTSTKRGMTPLMLALHKGHFETVKILIQHGANAKAVDELGEPTVFYGASHPVPLHVVKSLLGLDLATFTNAQGENLLFEAAKREDGHNTILYLCELAGLDVNSKSPSTGETALHVAAKANHLNVIKALMAKGADANATSNTGATPVTVKGGKHGNFILKCAREPNKTNLERMTQPDASNLGNLSMKQLQHFSVAFTVPNILLYLGSLLPTFIGMFLTFGSAAGFMLVAKFALGQKFRSLATAGWFSGALTFGSYVLVTRVFPEFQLNNPNGGAITTFWWIVTVLMYFCYAKAVLADPGAVQSSPEMRKTII
jgi:hypothetical protein